jgi:arylsulfatase A-like enzyme
MVDFSLELLATMPEAQRMVTEGASYRNAFVVDSLCCPSRASLLTGQAPHHTGVLTNTANDPDQPIGGYKAFVQRGNQERQFSLALQESGYTTGFVGKFMNGYEARTVDGQVVPPPRVPGWDVWNPILGGGYNGWGYKSVYLDDNGDPQLENHPKPPRTSPVEVLDKAYMQTVTRDKALAFIEEAESADEPYFLEVATYGPHSQLQKAYPDSPQFPPAYADRAADGSPTGGNCGALACGDLTVADLVGYGDPREDNVPTYLRPDGTVETAPAWRTNEITLTEEQALARYRDRARMVQSIDRMLTEIRAAVGPDTYVVLTADNGFHLGQHQLNGGKGTPYDSDARVPLVVVGPGVVQGERTQFVNNIDLAPTFEELAGRRPDRVRDGRSFADSLSRAEAPGARYAFYEHTFAKSVPGEVDTDEGSGGTIEILPSYVAVRGEQGLLVRLDLDPAWGATDHAWELYRYDRPWEDVNVFATDHTQPWARDLRRRLELWDGCQPDVCRAAAR